MPTKVLIQKFIIMDMVLAMIFWKATSTSGHNGSSIQGLLGNGSVYGIKIVDCHNIWYLLIASHQHHWSLLGIPTASSTALGESGRVGNRLKLSGSSSEQRSISVAATTPMSTSAAEGSAMEDSTRGTIREAPDGTSTSGLAHLDVSVHTEARIV